MHRPALKKCVFFLYVSSQTFSLAHAGDPPTHLARWLPWTSRDIGKRPTTAQDSTIEELAKNIDWLENRINLFGTVVAKSPDVWGEARLTAHRQEFEDVLKNELRLFSKDQINGAEFVSDQSFLAFALALKGPPTGSSTAITPPSVTINATTTNATSQPSTAGTASVSLDTNFTGSGQLFGTTSDGQKILGALNIKVEQTEMLDQLARYVNHLHSIRRINEGDDTSDSPGYSMNLVRIPVSILPGQHTKLGHGAEITVTAETYQGPELLPMAYRDFVINDLVDQLSLPLTRFLNADPLKADSLLNDLFPKYIENKPKVDSDIESINEDISQDFKQGLDGIDVRDGLFFTKDLKWKGILVTNGNLNVFRDNLEGIIKSLNEQIDQQMSYQSLASKSSSEARKSLQSIAPSFERQKKMFNLTQSQLDHIDSVTTGSADKDDRFDKAILQKITEESTRILYNTTAKKEEINRVLDRLKSVSQSVESVQKALNEISKIPIINLPSGTTRRSTLPFPPTQLICNYGLIELAYVAASAHRSFRADVINREVVHITDLQAFLREELAAAYELMNSEVMQHWWERARSGEDSLVQNLRMRNTEALAATRHEFISAITQGNTDSRCRIDQSAATLAWCVYVESLLLNERLVQDIRETLGNKPNTINCQQWLPYFGPNPPEEARMLFNEYVKVRWPIRVFALDPQINEQNIADVRSIYRQMQMAIALSFASGNIGVSAAMQSMRKLQRDRATFDLNRTAIGFGHGDDTFGWRFYPRFQTPPVEGNAKVFFRDLIVGGPTDKQLERSREIEPGMRECTAIVLMPSFVPHVTFTTRGNWFKLGKPGITADSVQDTVEYSRAIKQMETTANACVKCAHLYRDGEVDRLIKRVHQLDRKLPMQTMECQVPIENTLGGFEIFSAGTRELAPELNGWYGAPGYDPSRNCRMFLAGDNFSVPQSRLIVGNQEIAFRLLSRQVMEVTLPAGLASLRDRNLDNAEFERYNGYLDAHIATPYGVSGHLLIPVLRKPVTTLAIPTLASNTIRIRAVRSALVSATEPITVSSFVYPQSLNFFDLDVPANVGLESVTSRKIRFITNSGLDRLSDVGPVPIQRVGNSPRFVLSANESSTQFKDVTQPVGTRLGAAIKDHIDYLLRSNRSLGSVSYRVKVLLLDGDGPNILADVDGEIGIDVELVNPST